MTAARDPELQALLDKKAIEEVLLGFLRGCDRADPDLVERAYWPDGWEDHGGTFDGPASEWVAAVKARLAVLLTRGRDWATILSKPFRRSTSSTRSASPRISGRQLGGVTL